VQVTAADQGVDDVHDDPEERERAEEDDQDPGPAVAERRAPPERVSGGNQQRHPGEPPGDELADILGRESAAGLQVEGPGQEPAHPLVIHQGIVDEREGVGQREEDQPDRPDPEAGVEQQPGGREQHKVVEALRQAAFRAETQRRRQLERVGRDVVVEAGPDRDRHGHPRRRHKQDQQVPRGRVLAERKRELSGSIEGRPEAIRPNHDMYPGDHEVLCDGWVKIS
jgi:hypothetical protein